MLTKLTFILIPEISTAIAALRSGQVDKMGGALSGYHEMNLDQQKTLAAQEPDLQFQVTSSGGNGVMFRSTQSPGTPTSESGRQCRRQSTSRSSPPRTTGV